MALAGKLEVLRRRLAERVGVKKVFPHRFRHTFATWAIESGAREIDVQMLLGHSDLTMTQRYARAYTSEQAVRAHAALSPVARLNAASPYASRFGPSVGIPAHAPEVTHQIALPREAASAGAPASGDQRSEQRGRWGRA